MIPDIRRRFAAGDNYFTVNLNEFQLTPLEQYRIQTLIQETGSQILGSIVEFVNPTFKRYVVNVYLNVFNNVTVDAIEADVVSKLADYFANFSRKDLLPQSDLIALLEPINGIDSVNLNFLSEDIEHEINVLSSENTMFSQSTLSSTDIDSIYTAMVAAAGNQPLNTLSQNAILNIIFGNAGFQTLLANYIDSNGDIILNQSEMVMMRGGWYDRNNNYFQDIPNPSTGLGSVNIYILKSSNPI